MINEFVYPLRVHIEDTDFSGVVFHSNYLNFMERARSEWMDLLGFGMTWQHERGICFVVHTAFLRYLKPAKLHEKIEVVTSIHSLRPASMVYDQYLRLTDSPDKILCKAEIKLACVDLKLRPRAIPEIPILDSFRREKREL